MTRIPLRRNSAKSKALLIGIEYLDPNTCQDEVEQLPGIHDDVRRLKDHLVNKHKYPQEHVKILVDGHNDGTMRPTKLNILREIDELVSDVKAGDRLVFCFGGHCYQLVNRDFTENDGLDEAILTDGHNGPPVGPKDTYLDPETLPEDERKKLEEGYIVDDELRKRLVDQLPHGVDLVAIFDTCHSGTLLDLDYYWMNRDTRFMTIPMPRPFNLLRPPRRRATICRIVPSDLHPDGKPEPPCENQKRVFSLPLRPPLRRLSTFFKNLKGCESPPSSPTLAEPPRIISIASAEDHQSSWAGPNKSMVSVLIDILEDPESEGITCKQLVKNIGERLANMRIDAICKKRGSDLDPPKRKRICAMQYPQFGAQAKQMLNLPFRL